MITNQDDEPCSPKALANEILSACLQQVDFWMADNPEVIQAMTERELNLLNEQLKKQSHRCFKLLGFKKEEMG